MAKIEQMRVLLLGNGGREHAFAWKIGQSPLCEKLFIAPGNAGTGQTGENVDLSLSDFPAIAAFALEERIDLIVVGPEAPLVEGIVDFFRADDRLQHIRLIGPARQGALLEGSKSFAKEFMQKRHIPTAAHREFGSAQLEEGLRYLTGRKPPIVLKADGLAAGKGVLICGSVAEAKDELKAMLGGKFGEASSTVVIEEFLDGIEFSVFALTDGQSYKLLPVAKDYKRIGEGDTGLNTGGMGAVSPVSFVDQALMEKVETRIVQPTIQGLSEERMDYCGFVFFGLISVNGDPFVIEYNCRMGDPETEVVFPRLQSDLLQLMLDAADGRLADAAIEIDERAAATVMLVSGGYPGHYEKHKPIEGLEAVSNSLVFHAGTRQSERQVLTNGGRVLAVTSYGHDFRAALANSLKNAELVDFEGKYYRRDIGFDL